MIDAFKGASGKICGHSDMGATYNTRTGQTYSHKLCNKRDLNALPYSDKENAQHEAFKKRTSVISDTIKSLTEDQRMSLIHLRNERGLFGYRQLIEEIYDKKTNTVPAAALTELLAQAKKSTGTASGSGSNPSTGGGGTSAGGDEETM